MGRIFWILFLYVPTLALGACDIKRNLPKPKHVGKFSRTFHPKDISESVKRGLGKYPNIWEESGLLEGDIASPKVRNVIKNDNYRWPGGVVPYIIDECKFNATQIGWIKEAMNEIESKTCIRFREYQKGDTSYISIQSDHKGCWSMVGRYEGGQVVNFQTSKKKKLCLKHGTVVHELMHSLGVYHQHSSPDRDDFLKIFWNNIKDGKARNFRKYTTHETTTFNLTYDYNSIMHYSMFGFTKNGEPTIVPRQEGATIGQRIAMSQIDIEKIKRMYKCEKPNPLYTSHKHKLDCEKQPSASLIPKPLPVLTPMQMVHQTHLTPMQMMMPWYMSFFP